MKTSITTHDYRFTDEVYYNGLYHYSSYNHNYYTNDEGEIILEECDDDNGFSYYRIDPMTGSDDYLGFSFGYGGIFEDGEKIVTLDSEIF